VVGRLPGSVVRSTWGLTRSDSSCTPIFQIGGYRFEKSVYKGSIVDYLNEATFRER